MQKKQHKISSGFKYKHTDLEHSKQHALLLRLMRDSCHRHTHRSSQRFNGMMDMRGTQADRYLPNILQNIKVDSRRWQWVVVQGQKNLLTHVSMHTLGYNFKGTTDMVLCSRNAVRSNIHTSGMRVLLEVKKAPVHDDSHQAMVILLLANSLNPKFKPVVVLTDLRDSWVFFWLEGHCIWHSAQDRPAAAGILEDMLQQEELNNSEVQTLPKEDCDRLGIYKRQILDPNAVGQEDQRDTSLAE